MNLNYSDFYERDNPTRFSGSSQGCIDILFTNTAQYQNVIIRPKDKPRMN